MSESGCMETLHHDDNSNNFDKNDIVTLVILVKIKTILVVAVISATP